MFPWTKTALQNRRRWTVEDGYLIPFLSKRISLKTSGILSCRRWCNEQIARDAISQLTGCYRMELSSIRKHERKKKPTSRSPVQRPLFIRKLIWQHWMYQILAVWAFTCSNFARLWRRRIASIRKKIEKKTERETNSELLKCTRSICKGSWPHQQQQQQTDDGIA